MVETRRIYFGVYKIQFMTIGIILHPYGEAQPGGLARTILEWTRALLATDQYNQYVIFIKGKPRTLPDFSDGRFTFEFLGNGLFWLNRLKKAPPADLYIFQTPVLPLFFKPKKSVVIAQDFPYLHLRPKSIREYFLNFVIRRYHAFSFKRADKIIAVSDSTKKEVMRFFNISPERVSVIHMGFKNICASEPKAVDLPEKFFLFVGVIKERKNVLRIVQAFQGLPDRKGAGYKLVLAGRRSLSRYSDIVDKYIREHQLEADVIYLGHLDDYELAYVYRKTVALVFPSIVESFGFPVLEAMACGTPVITSNIGGPSEIGANNAATLINPYKSEEIAGAMARITNDKNFRAEVIKKGLERAKEFSWEKAARATLALIKTL